MKNFKLIKFYILISFPIRWIFWTLAFILKYLFYLICSPFDAFYIVRKTNIKFYNFNKHINNKINKLNKNKIKNKS